jgi:hypothetical protein
MLKQVTKNIYLVEGKSNSCFSSGKALEAD